MNLSGDLIIIFEYYRAHFLRVNSNDKKAAHAARVTANT